MKTITDSIYDGDFRPSEDILSWNDELCTLYARSAEKLTEIREGLSDKQEAGFDEYTELQNRICDETAKAGFRMGLSLGIRLITESFSYVQKLSEETESDDT